MSRRAWTTGEEAALKVIASLGVEHCAYVLSRSRSCIKKKASRLGVSLKPGRGIDVTGLSPAFVERVRESVDKELCPACGLRPIGVLRTGLCGVCHKNKLIEEQRAELQALEAHKEQQVVWQQKSRLRRSMGQQ